MYQVPSFRRVFAALAAFACLTLGTSCAVLEEALTAPKAEAPIPVEESYLRTGPTMDAAHGQGAQTLLQEFSEVSIENQRVAGALEAERTRIESLRTQLGATEAERDAAIARGRQLEQEVERMRARSVDLERKILALEIETAHMRQSELQQQIQRLREELALEQATVGRGPTGDARQLDLVGR
jgi:hypothetical protein